MRATNWIRKESQAAEHNPVRPEVAATMAPGTGPGMSYGVRIRLFNERPSHHNMRLLIEMTLDEALELTESITSAFWEAYDYQQNGGRLPVPPVVR